MARYNSTAEVASPSLSANSSYIQEPQSPYSTSNASRPSLRYNSTAAVASPFLSANSSFLQEPQSPYSPSNESRPSLREQTSHTGLIGNEEYFESKTESQPKPSLWKIFRRNRFMKAFAEHPENPTVARRTYGLFHGHSFETSQYVKKNVTGWKVGLRWATIATFTVFFANTIFLIVTIASHGNNDGMATLYSGKCDTVASYDTGIHILINILSTTLLGASSYVMQCLNSPSREQVDQAHAQGKTMDIGMPSFKNARRVGWRQTGLWLSLGISALPLHIFWNSSVFATLEANQYDMFVVPSDFSTTDFNCDLPAGCDNAESLWAKSKTESLDHLDNAECIKTYSSNFLAGRRNLLLITSNATRGWQETATTQAVTNDSTVYGIIMSRHYEISLGDSSWTPTAWWCDASSKTNSTGGVTSNWYSTVRDYDSESSTTACKEDVAIKHAEELQVFVKSNQTRDQSDFYDGKFHYDIDYCLSEKVDEVCQLQSANYVWLIVIICNAIKLACMCLASRALGSNTSPLVVVGDAVASFLENPDKTTEYNCLMSARKAGQVPPPEGRVWKQKRPFWLMSSSRCSFAKTFSICGLVLLILTVTFNLIGAWRSNNGPSWTTLPFGGVAPSTILAFQLKDPSSFSTLMLVLLFVNSPQIVFSSLYFMYNSVLTAMLAMQEFSRFAYRRRTLRVSAPVGKQRYTYWLQLPYTYSFPLLTTSGLMHWFISQSLFLARIQVIDEYGNFMENSSPDSDDTSMFTLPAYSPKAIVCALSLGAAMVLVIFGLGFRRHNGGVPLVANNTMAISAACHVLGGEKDVALKPLMWGAVMHPIGEVPGHCSFSSRHVEPPIVGQRYA